MIGLERLGNLRHIPAGQVAVDAVHQGRVVSHFRRHRAEQMADPLLVLHVHLEVAHHDDAAVGPDALLAPAELAGLHVALHDVHAVLLVEGHAGDLVEAHHVVLADQSPLAIRHVHEHPGDGRLAAADQVGIRRNLLEQVALAGAARAEFHHVVVVLDERNHAQQQRVEVAGRDLRRLQADAAEQEVLPISGREPPPACVQSRPKRPASIAGSDARPRSQNGRPFFSWAITAS